MPKIIIPLSYNTDYWQLQGTWFVSGNLSGSYQGYGPPIFPPPPVWNNYSNGIGASYDPATGKMIVSLPSGTSLSGTWSGHYIYGAGHNGNPNAPFADNYGTVTNPLPVCECTPVIRRDAVNKTASGYDLTLSLEAGDCSGPLTSITWIPTPTSGQGTTNAVYTNRQYNRLYEGGVGAISNATCEIAANFSFSLPPGSNPPSCQL